MNVRRYKLVSLCDTCTHRRIMLTYNLLQAVGGQHLDSHFYYGTKRQTS